MKNLAKFWMQRPFRYLACQHEVFFAVKLIVVFLIQLALVSILSSKAGAALSVAVLESFATPLS